MKHFLFSVILLLFLFAGCSEKKKTADGNIDNYRDFIIKLPKNDLYSITKGLDYFKTNMNGSIQEYRDSAFIDFRNLYYNVINNTSEIFWNNQNLINKISGAKDDPEVIKFKRDLDTNGLRLSLTEGNYYLDEKPDYLFNHFKNTVSTSIREYLQIRMKELEEGFSENAALTISFRSLGQRIRVWEEYIKKYPNSPLIAEAKFSYHLYLNTFITGLDNTPVAVDQKLKPEIKSEYEYYISQNKDSESGKIVYNYYNILSQNSFTLTADLDQFYKDNSVEPMQGVQPPTR